MIERGGLTRGKVVPFIFRLFRGHLSHWRTTCHTLEKTGVERGPNNRRDTIVAYPAIEDWDKHMANVGEVKKLLEEMIAEVDGVMMDVPNWLPVLAEEVVLPTRDAWDMW